MTQETNTKGMPTDEPPLREEVRVEWNSLKATAEKATPGPWRECGHDRGGCVCRQVWSLPADGLVTVAQRYEETEGEGFTQEQAVHNTNFIAAASPDVILRLIAENESLKARLKEGQIVLSKNSQV